MDADFWVTVLASGVVAAVSSTIIGAIFNLYKFKRESEAGFVQARAELYSYLFFWLRIWLAQGIEQPIHLEDFIPVDKFLSLRLHLVNSEIQKEWLTLHDEVVAETFEDAVDTALKLVELIKKEFNEDIIPKYEKYVGKNIQKLAS